MCMCDFNCVCSNFKVLHAAYTFWISAHVCTFACMHVSPLSLEGLEMRSFLHIRGFFVFPRLNKEKATKETLGYKTSHQDHELLKTAMFVYWLIWLSACWSSKWEINSASHAEVLCLRGAELQSNTTEGRKENCGLRVFWGFSWSLCCLFKEVWMNPHCGHQDCVHLNWKVCFWWQFSMHEPRDYRTLGLQLTLSSLTIDVLITFINNCLVYKSSSQVFGN